MYVENYEFFLFVCQKKGFGGVGGGCDFLFFVM